MAGNDEENKQAKTRSENLETALRTFKGKCNKCHEVGHKVKDCPKKKVTQEKSTEKAGASVKSKSAKKCSHCNKSGHSESDCWKKHPEKVPEWAKDMHKKNGEAASALEGELLLSAINTPLPLDLEDELMDCEEMDACLSLDIS